MPELAMIEKIESVPMEAIKPYWRNPRKNDAAVPVVKESIKQFGVNQPIVVDKKGVIIVGHTRYRAMMELGYQRAPVVRANHLSAKQAREYRIADNKTAEVAEWDHDALIPELRDTDLSIMSLFYEEKDLAKLLGEANGMSFTPVSADQMDKVLDKHQHAGAPGTGGRAALVKLTCPHCDEDFQVDPAALERGEK